MEFQFEAVTRGRAGRPASNRRQENTTTIRVTRAMNQRLNRVVAELGDIEKFDFVEDALNVALKRGVKKANDRRRRQPSYIPYLDATIERNEILEQIEIVSVPKEISDWSNYDNRGKIREFVATLKPGQGFVVTGTPAQVKKLHDSWQSSRRPRRAHIELYKRYLMYIPK